MVETVDMKREIETVMYGHRHILRRTRTGKLKLDDRSPVIELIKIESNFIIELFLLGFGQSPTFFKVSMKAKQS